jgi:6-pyruvoyltetrahydropterin/6-carboxytetrahydropterin synthase
MHPQYIGRKGSFDSGHRVMNEKMKCFNMHGHTYLYELIFQFTQMEDIGYAIDFKEIKRVGIQWIDDALDHGMLLNPKDSEVIKAAQATESKLWLMSLNGKNAYCNPSVENIAKEIFLAMEILFANRSYLKIHQIRLFETPNCFTDCFINSISDQEKAHFLALRKNELEEYAQKKGRIEYDDRRE